MSQEGASSLDFKLDSGDITSTYHQKRSVYDSLLKEVVFILEDIVRSQDIKIHGIEHRVKTLDSILGKSARKQSNDPFSTFDDIVGARLICLFRSDLDRAKAAIDESFTVVKIDDKLAATGNPLGYVSIHFTCKMKAEYKGPRYTKIGDVLFEIQLRTLCMHCWAAVSHYLDYKGEWDVPINLRMDLNALGGLFYLADSQFEQFHTASLASRQTAQAAPRAALQDEINLDTVTVYLSRKFSSRETPRNEAISELVQQVKEAGYRTIHEMDRDIDRAAPNLPGYEKEVGGGGDAGAMFLNQVGAARASLYLSSDAFFALQRVDPGWAVAAVRDKFKVRK
jgi:putative GTP pyrophosphokinase